MDEITKCSGGNSVEERNSDPGGKIFKTGGEECPGNWWMTFVSKDGVYYNLTL